MEIIQDGIVKFNEEELAMLNMFNKDISFSGLEVLHNEYAFARVGAWDKGVYKLIEKNRAKPICFITYKQDIVFHGLSVSEITNMYHIILGKDYYVIVVPCRGNQQELIIEVKVINCVDMNIHKYEELVTHINNIYNENKEGKEEARY
jgi:hypothetical protein